MSDWYPGAIRDEGPADKQGYTGTGQRTEKSGVIGHSMVGSYTSAKRELMNPARRASWTFSLLKDGRRIQHYPIRSVTWHGGSRYANEQFVGIEHEGGFSPHDEPLTPIQFKALVELLAWLGDEFGWTEWTRQVTLFEHNEMTRYGSAPTACPSGRIPWASIQTALDMEDDVDQEARDAIKALKTQHAKDMEALEARFEAQGPGHAFQNALIEGAYGGIKWLSESLRIHEERIKKLEN